MPGTFRELLLRRGLKADLPVLEINEPGWCTDTKELFIGTSSGNKLIAKTFIPNAPDWQGTPPSSASDAINRIATAVVGLLGGPIP